MILVTGGAGFIGANFVARLAGTRRASRSSTSTSSPTPATSAASRSLRGDARHVFVRGDIGDRAQVDALLAQHRPRAIVNFAAETHVDRSIHGPAAFVDTNVVGTFNLLEAARAFWSALPEEERRAFRFLHVSTDEVYGSLGPDDPPFTETSAYAPNSPVLGVEGGGRPSGARLSSHVRVADAHDQLLEQLRPAPVSGEAHSADDRQCDRRQAAAGLRRRPQRSRLALCRRSLRGDPRGARGGVPGATYNVGGDAEMTNLDVVGTICRILGELAPGRDYASLVTFVKDRPGHDRRYAIDADEDPPRAGVDSRRIVRQRNAQDGAMVSRQRRVARRGDERGISQMDLAQLRRRDGMRKAMSAIAKGNHPGRRLGHAALSGDARGVEAAAAGVRQADDLLPADDADAGGHSRHPADLHAGGHAALRAAPGRRRAMGSRAVVRGAAGARAASRRRSSSAASFVGGDASRAGAGRQHLLRPRFLGAARARQRPHRRGDGVRVSGRRSRALRRGRARRVRPRA